MTGKRALIILTNEAFLPKSGRGGRRMNANGPTPTMIEDGPTVMGSPASWTTPQPTIHDPPQKYSAIQETEQTFGRMHQRTGVDIFELGYLWMTLKRQCRMELVFATPRGGPVAADPMSVERMEKDSKLRDTLRDEREFISKMGHTLPISWVKPEEFNLVIIPGGHGAMFDLPEHDDVSCAIAEIYQKGGMVAAIGHGVASLLNVRMKRKGEYFVKGFRLACFSNSEEKEVGYEEYLPYSLEDRLRERGSKVENKKPFETNVIVDERLITAQSAPSIHEFVTKITETMRRT